MTIRRTLVVLFGIALSAAVGTTAAAETTDPNESTEHSHGPGWDASRPDSHAPIGVMGDHLHGEGEFMLSYRYMRMHMDGNREGTDSVSAGSILRPNGKYPVVPTEMNMQMHMVGAMYAPKDWVTLMAMFPFVVIDMDHRTATGQKFTTRSSGIGDIKTTALIRLLQRPGHTAHLNAGVSWPTGSIDRKDNTPASMGQNTQLPYPMQLGSGTVDLLPGVTYSGQGDWSSWGSQAMGTIRLGRNSENYRFGHEYMLTSWAAAVPHPWFSIGGRIQWRQWFDVEGQDDRLGSPMGIPAKDFVPTADPDLRGGMQLDIGPSVNFITKKGALKGLRFAFEMLLPVYRDLDGPQLETDWTLTAGIQYAF